MQRSATARDFAAGIGCSVKEGQKFGYPDQMDRRFFLPGVGRT